MEHLNLKKFKRGNFIFAFRKKKNKKKNCEKHTIPTCLLIHKLLGEMHVLMLIMQ